MVYMHMLHAHAHAHAHAYHLLTLTLAWAYSRTQFKYSKWTRYVPYDLSDLDKEIVQVPRMQHNAPHFATCACGAFWPAGNTTRYMTCRS